MERPRHLNSLGYIVAGSATERASAQAMIAWGEQADGVLVHIDDAAAGLADGLKCACGAPLVARKGSVRVHHFGHKAGTAETCEQAQLDALHQFARKALSEAGALSLPPIRGQRLSTTVDEIRGERFEHCAGVWVTTVKGEKRSEIAVLFRLRKGQELPSAEHFEALGKSAMMVDLATHRNRPDPHIARAICAAGNRAWIHNARLPNRTEQNAENTVGERRRQIRFPKGGASRSPRATPQPTITEEEWRTLHYTELRRRVFGWTDKK